MASPISAAAYKEIWRKLLNEAYEEAFRDTDWSEVFDTEYRTWTIEELSERGVLDALREIEDVRKE